MYVSTDDQPEATLQYPASRYRFSLKWLLLVMAILCVLLGIYATLERKAREMLSLNNSILNVIEENFGLEPLNTTFFLPESLRRTTADFMKRTRTEDYERRKQGEHVFSGRTLYATSSYNTELDVANVLVVPGANNVAVRLLSHYAKGFTELGLSQTSITTSPDTATAIWQIPDHGVTVVIDVILDASSKQAKVRAIFVQSDRTSIW